MTDRSKAFVPNPALGSLANAGILAAAARDLPSGVFLGLGAALSAIILGAVLPPLRRELPERFRAHVSFALAATLAIVIGALVEAYFPLTSSGLWIYLPLLAVNSLNLQSMRLSSSPAPRTGIGPSRLGAIARGAGGYALVACAVGAFREAAGSGTLTVPGPGAALIRAVLVDRPPCRFLAAPAGGFILIGFLAALYRVTLRARGRRVP